MPMPNPSPMPTPTDEAIMQALAEPLEWESPISDTDGTWHPTHHYEIYADWGEHERDSQVCGFIVAFRCVEHTERYWNREEAKRACNNHHLTGQWA